MRFVKSLLHLRFGNKGISFIVAAIILTLLLAGFFVLPKLVDTGLQSSESERYLKGAKIVADKLKPLPLIDIAHIADSVDAIDKINFMIREINEVFKVDFPEFSKDDRALLNDIQELIPLVEPYNQLIKSARDYDETNTTSAKQLIIDAYILAFGVIVVEGKISYSIAFKMTGILNNILKLGVLRSIVGNVIYSEFLGKIHWFLREKITNPPTQLSDAINTALRQIGYTW